MSDSDESTLMSDAEAAAASAKRSTKPRLPKISVGSEGEGDGDESTFTGDVTKPETRTTRVTKENLAPSSAAANGRVARKDSKVLAASDDTSDSDVVPPSPDLTTSGRPRVSISTASSARRPRRAAMK